MKTKNMTTRERAHVTRIVSGNDGKVTGVQYIRDGQEYFSQPAVLLASYTYENVRLLMLSVELFPNGLSNNHGQVGKHFISTGGAGTSARFL
jgi:choline dehydrogenase-like flavoprotein